jgi:AbrB family looped-hinge helix DNA binding protein
MADYFTKVAPNGRMTLPASVRAALGVEGGGYVRIVPTDDASFVLEPTPDISSLVGLVNPGGRSASVTKIRRASRATFDE